MTSVTPRVRIAPSPTGDPHVGTAYVALFNYAFAKRHGGKFILRIEDTDQARSSREAEEAIIRSLRWLGLSWDEGPDVGGPHGPYRQSERASIYQEHAALLVEQGEAYPCFCTAERLAELRAQRVGATSGYDGLCRAVDAASARKRVAAGEAHVIRLKMPKDGEARLVDLIRGSVAIPNERSDDQVLLKSDGLPTYHLANVVDDHLMQITHVVRAEEWISSAPKHLRLYQAFGWAPPRFAHLPLLRNNDKNKSKISKRRNPVSLDYYREIGILPEVMLNFLALMGWSFGDDREKFSLDEMVQRFDLTEGSISLSGPVFDLEKLAWLNGNYLRELSDAELIDRLMAWRLNRDYLLLLAPLIRDRIRKFDEFVPATSFFFSGDLDYAEALDLLVPKGRQAKETAGMLAELVEQLDGLRPWTAPALEEFFRSFSEKTGWKTKDVFMSVRIVISGRKASPPLFDTMVVAGRERIRRRFRQAVEFLKQKS
jgi:glutamyl-tRNA synthetase